MRLSGSFILCIIIMLGCGVEECENAGADSTICSQNGTIITRPTPTDVLVTTPTGTETSTTGTEDDTCPLCSEPTTTTDVSSGTTNTNVPIVTEPTGTNPIDQGGNAETPGSDPEALQDNTRSDQLTWDPPTTNTDETPLTDLAGYKIFYGTEPGNYTTWINVGNTTTWTISGLTYGVTYYYSVKAYNLNKAESDFADEISKLK